MDAWTDGWMGGCDNGWMTDVCLIRYRSTSTDLEIKTSKQLKNPSHCYLGKNVKKTMRQTAKAQN